MFPTTYPKIAARGIETQPGSNPSRLLPRVCLHSVYMTEILFLFFLYYDIFSMHRLHHSVFADVLNISEERSPILITTPPGTWPAHNLPPHDLSLFKSCDLQVWWIRMSTTMSISCPICIQEILLMFYVHTSNQFLGTFTPFPSRSYTINHICLIFPPLHWLNPTKAKRIFREIPKSKCPQNLFWVKFKYLLLKIKFCIQISYPFSQFGLTGPCHPPDCHTPVLGNWIEASIHVPRMFKSHVRPTIWWIDTISH
jgi:hypothetical protein